PPLRRLLAHMLDFAYPGACAACESSCDGDALLCPDCTAQLNELADAPSCEWCAMPLPAHGAPCPYCFGKGVPHFDRVIRLGIYEHPLKQIIHHLKYHRRWPLGEHLADRL